MSHLSACIDEHYIPTNADAFRNYHTVLVSVIPETCVKFSFLFSPASSSGCMTNKIGVAASEDFSLFA